MVARPLQTERRGQCNVTWQYMKEQLQTNYQRHTFQIERLNEFLDCTQGKDTLDTFYQKFLKLLKYAPDGMMEETKVARFMSKHNSPLDNRRQYLRLTTFAETLDAGRPINEEGPTYPGCQIEGGPDTQKFKI